MARSSAPDDRGQAYTLESLIAALLLVTAVLFALQSVVITPTSAGSLDRDVQAQLHQQASDALVTAANDGELSEMARHWDCASGTEAFATDDRAGFWNPVDGYSNDTVPVVQFGETLEQTFDEGTRYNVELVYENETGHQGRSYLVYQGGLGPEVVAASTTVTLTDDQPVTAQNGTRTLSGCSDPPIPDAHDGSGESVYNVVEVRLVVW